VCEAGKGMCACVRLDSAFVEMGVCEFDSLYVRLGRIGMRHGSFTTVGRESYRVSGLGRSEEAREWLCDVVIA
jgi:hypothetical protein